MLTLFHLPERPAGKVRPEVRAALRRLRTLVLRAGAAAFARLPRIRKRVRAAAVRVGRAICGLFRLHGGKIAYYAAVLAVLGAVAVAAESYRRPQDESGQTELLLPETPAAAPAMADEAAPAMYEDVRVLRGYEIWPEYNAELAQWETHPALDLAPEAGTEVCALDSGTVEAVYESAIYGKCVEIRSGNVLYRYASLGALENLCPGDAVERGARLGGTGETLAAERALGAHLHLEIYSGGKPVRFEELWNGTKNVDD